MLPLFIAAAFSASVVLSCILFWTTRPQRRLAALTPVLPRPGRLFDGNDPARVAPASREPENDAFDSTLCQAQAAALQFISSFEPLGPVSTQLMLFYFHMQRTGPATDAGPDFSSWLELLRKTGLIRFTEDRVHLTVAASEFLRLRMPPAEAALTRGKLADPDRAARA